MHKLCTILQASKNWRLMKLTGTRVYIFCGHGFSYNFPSQNDPGSQCASSTTRIFFISESKTSIVWRQKEVLLLWDKVGNYMKYLEAEVLMDIKATPLATQCHYLDYRGENSWLSWGPRGHGINTVTSMSSVGSQTTLLLESSLGGLESETLAENASFSGLFLTLAVNNYARWLTIYNPQKVHNWSINENLTKPFD